MGRPPEEEDVRRMVALGTDRASYSRLEVTQLAESWLAQARIIERLRTISEEWGLSGRDSDSAAIIEALEAAGKTPPENERR